MLFNSVHQPSQGDRSKCGDSVAARSTRNSPAQFRNIDFIDETSQHGIHSNSRELESSISTYPINTQGWTSFYLRKATLLSFLFIEALLLVSLIVLYKVDQRNTGIATANSSLRYIWTYGPVAIITLTASFWTRIEYRCTQMEPWRQLAQNHPTPASRILLLDYVSMSQPRAAFSSIKHQHWAVAAAVSASILLQLLKILSTGLFTLEDVNIGRNTTLLVTDQFDQTAWDSPGDGYFSRVGYIMPTLAIQGHNLSYPVGTSKDFAIPSLKLEDLALSNKNATIDVAVDTFHAEIDCEPVTLSIYRNDSCGSDSSTGRCWPSVRIASSSCVVSDFSWRYPQGYPQRDTVYGAVYSVYCGNNLSVHAPNKTLISSGVIRGFDQNSLWVVDRLDNVTAYLCEPKYDVSPASVKIDTAGNIISVTKKPNSSYDHHLGTVTPLEFDARLRDGLFEGTGMVIGAASSQIDMIDINTNNITLNGDTYDLIIDGFFSTLAIFSKADDYAFFLNQHVVLNQSKAMYSQMAAQLAKQQFMATASDTIIGNGYTIKPRLRVFGLALYWMVATVSLLILLTFSLCFTMAPIVVSRDPGTIGGLAAIISQSQHFCETLHSISIPTKCNLKKALDTKVCVAPNKDINCDHAFTIDIVDLKTENAIKDTQLLDQSPQLKSTPTQAGWWHPWPLRTTISILILVFLVALIITLTVTAQVSERNDGLAFVNIDDYTRYAWAYIPALTMVIVQTLIEARYFIWRVLLPYYELRKSTSTDALLNNQLSRLTIQSLFSSVTRKQWDFMAISIAMLVSPLLTIVVSNLYAPQLVEYTLAVNLTQVSNFDPGFYDALAISVNTTTTNSFSRLTLIDEGTSFMVSMLNGYNVTDPPWTYGPLAFNQVRLQAGEAELPQNSNLTVRILAVRASMNCTAILSENLNTTFTDENREGWSPVVVDWNTSSLNTQCISNNITIYIPPDPGMVIANATWLPHYENQPDDCPQLMVVYGLPNNRSSSGLQALSCTVPVEQVQVDTTFSLPDYTILAAVPDENTATTFIGLGNAYAQDFWGIGPSILFAGKLNSSDNPYASGFIVDNAYVDYTFKTLFEWMPLLSTEDLAVTPASRITSSRKISSALSVWAGKIHAQYINLGGRVPVTNSSSHQPLLSGKIYQPGRFRLQQNSIPTYVLQAILLTIALSYAFSLCSMRIRRILPANPCSIAASASLLAGTKMLKRIPPRAEFLKRDSDLARLGGLDDQTFSLGWWEEYSGRGKFRIDVGRCSSFLPPERTQSQSDSALRLRPVTLSAVHSQSLAQGR